MSGRRRKTQREKRIIYKPLTTIEAKRNVNFNGQIPSVLLSQSGDCEDYVNKFTINDCYNLLDRLGYSNKMVTYRCGHSHHVLKGSVMERKWNIWKIHNSKRIDAPCVLKNKCAMCEIHIITLSDIWNYYQVHYTLTDIKYTDYWGNKKMNLV